MSRTGQIRVQSHGNGDYTLELSLSAAIKPKPSCRVTPNDIKVSY